MRWLALLSLLLVPVTSLAASPEPSPAAMSVYDEGKRLYDGKDYTSALERFDRCASMEPQVARWQYNRGLALKKLKRDGEAREAFHRSQGLDPAYKAQGDWREAVGAGRRAARHRRAGPSSHAQHEARRLVPTGARRMRRRAAVRGRALRRLAAGEGLEDGAQVGRAAG